MRSFMDRVSSQVHFERSGTKWKMFIFGVPKIREFPDSRHSPESSRAPRGALGPRSALCFCLRQRRLSAILFIRSRDCHCCTEVRLIAEIGLHICLIAFRLEFVIHLQNFVVCCVAVLCVFCVSGWLCSTSSPGGN